MALISTLTDNFDDNSIDLVKWNADYIGTGWSFAEQNQELEATSALTGDSVDRTSVANYDLTGSQESIKIVDAGNQALNSWYVAIGLIKDSSNKLYYQVAAGDLQVRQKLTGSWSTLDSIAYNSTNHKYIRIRESGGTTYWDYSANGITWTNQYSKSNPFAITSLTAIIDIGAGVELSTTTAKVDDFNLINISQLTDNFNDNSIDGAKWAVWKDSNGSVAETNGQIEITSGTTGTVTELYSVNKYDLTGSQATIKIIDAGDLTLTSYECRFVLYKDSSNWVRWSIKGDGDVIDVDFNVGGSASTKHSHSYVAATYRYLKIREASGTIYFDYSADGISWTNMYSDTNPFAVTSLEIDLDIRASGEVSTTTAKVDDFNILPSAWTKTFTDGITSTITFNRLFIGNRIFTETSSLVETLGKAEDKKLSDSCTFSGTLNKSPDKKLSDGITLNESLVKYVAKIMLETIGVVENIVTDIVKFLSLIFTTSVTFVENLFKDSDKKFVDTITANEELIKDFSRNLTETVGISTNIVKHAVKIVTESVTVNEAIVKSFEKYLIDSVALVETITTEKAVFKIISQFITDRGILTIDDLRSMKSDFPQLSMGDLKIMQRDFPSLTINDLQTMEQDIRRMLKDFK